MAILSAAARDAAVQAVVDFANSGSGTSRAFLVLYTSGFGTQVDSDFIADAHPAFPAVSGGSSTAPAKTALSTVNNAGTIVGYSVFNRDSVAVVFSSTGVGDVGSGADIEMNVRAVTVGQRYATGAITIAMAAS